MVEVPMDPVIDVSVYDDTPHIEHDDDGIAVDHSRWRRGRWARLLGVLVAVGVAGGGLWWHHAVTAEPGLVLDGGPNVFRNEQGGDIGGITRVENHFRTD